jgi:hypothetical protein
MSFGFSEFPEEGEDGPPSLADLCLVEVSNYVRIWFASKLLDKPTPVQETEHQLEEGGAFFLSDSDDASCEEDIEISALTIRTPQLLDEIDDSFDALARILTGEQKGRLLSIVAQKSGGFGFDYVESWVKVLAAEADSLDFTACAKLGASTVRSMLTSSPSLPLTSLNFTKCGDLLSPILLAEIAPSVPQLCELRLSGGFMASGPADAALMRVASVCPRLRLLDVSACKTIGDAAVSRAYLSWLKNAICVDQLS